MSGRALDFGIVVRLTDQFSAPMRAVTGAINFLDRTAGNTQGLQKLSNQLSNLSLVAGKLGLVAGGVSGGIAVALGLHQLPGQVVDAERAMRTIGNIGDLTGQQLAFARTQIVEMSRATNQEQMALIAGLDVLTARGLAFEQSMALLPTIGRTATAMDAEIGDLSRTAFSMSDNLKVGADQMHDALEAAATAGQRGAFELKDMARFFPVITAAAAKFGQTGVPAVARMGAALQVAFKGAGDPGIAATNLENYLKAFSMPIVQKNFQEHGVDIVSVIHGVMARHGDVIEETAKVVQRLTNGDFAKIGEIFRDAEAQNFLTPMLANMKTYRAIRDEAMKGTGLIDRNYVNMLTTTTEQMKKLRIESAATANGPLVRFFGGVKRVLMEINDHPIAHVLLMGAAGFGALAAAAFGATSLVLAGLSQFAKYPALVSWLSGGLQTLQLRAMYAGDWFLKLSRLSTFQWIAAGLRTATTAAWGFASALFANPITWIVLGVAALGVGLYFLIKHFDAVKAWLARFGHTIYEAGRGLILQLARGMLSYGSLPVMAIAAVAKKIRGFLPFSPAKEGPLSDLHRVRIVETIASTIRPEPVARAMRRATATVALAAGVGPLAAQSSRSAAPTAITIHAPTTITITSAGAMAADELDRKLADHRRRIRDDMLAATRGELREQY